MELQLHRIALRNRIGSGINRTRGLRRTPKSWRYMVSAAKSSITDRFIRSLCTRIESNKPVRRSLPIWGRVHIDRQLPFLCVYRRKKHNANLQTDRLIRGEASYLSASASRSLSTDLSELSNRIVETLADQFGGSIVVEIWESELNANTPDDSVIHIFCGEDFIESSTISALVEALSRITVQKRQIRVETKRTNKISPPMLPTLISESELKRYGGRLIGIALPSVYYIPDTKEVLPIALREFHRGLSRALKRSLYEFVRRETTHRPQHYESLGRGSMVKAVWEVDRRLADLHTGFDFLLQVTPTNSRAAWSAFKKSKFERAPAFSYRPLSIDPELTKKRLYALPIAKIEDPTLSDLFRAQQLEMDRMLTMLIDRGTRRFLYGSLQLYGEVDDALLKTAKEILTDIPPRTRGDSSVGALSSDAFAEMARQEIDYFRQILPEIRSKVIVRDDIPGLLVSEGNLLVGRDVKIPANRAEALIQHEVGTHVLTYVNGRAQPFKQLHIGLPGYEELQEGLAVFSEYLTGGLTSSRLRLLAARVISANSIVDGGSFVDVFRELTHTYGFATRTAFNIAVRIFRSGGLVKDAIYLRGLIWLIKYIKQGGELEPLYVGKFAASHLPIIRELRHRKVIEAPAVRPRYFDDPHIIDSIKNIEGCESIAKLTERRRK